jgi:hypothetical protein
MDNRDKARSDLYLAQLRTQTAPNTPGFGPLSPSYSTYAKSPRLPPSASFATSASDAEEGYAPGTRFVDASRPGAAAPAKPFALQAPPIKIHAASPKSSVPSMRSFTPPAPAAETHAGHAPVAPGEQQYAAVPIPGAYQPASPGPAQTTFNFGTTGAPGQAVTSEHRIESPPSSPRLPRLAPRFA